jgi:hypothetical protein
VLLLRLRKHTHTSWVFFHGREREHICRTLQCGDRRRARRLRGNTGALCAMRYVRSHAPFSYRRAPPSRSRSRAALQVEPMRCTPLQVGAVQLQVARRRGGTGCTPRCRPGFEVQVAPASSTPLTVLRGTAGTAGEGTPGMEEESTPEMEGIRWRRRRRRDGGGSDLRMPGRALPLSIAESRSNRPLITRPPRKIPATYGAGAVWAV